MGAAYDQAVAERCSFNERALLAQAKNLRAFVEFVLFLNVYFCSKYLCLVANLIERQAQ